MPSDINSPALAIRLFGPMEVRVGAEPLPHLRSRKGLWLLALLVLREGRDVDRDWLAGTLWPDYDEAHSRRSLRQSLHDLRAALGSEAWRLKSDEPRALGLALEGVSVDALEFDAAVNDGNAESLQVAASLYRGPLLEGCAEEWALVERRKREQLYLNVLERLAVSACESGDHGRSSAHFRAALALDPYREEFLRGLMEALAADGSPAAALLAYRQFRALLARELAGEPDAETTALFNRLKSESRLAAARPLAATKPRTVQSESPVSLRSLPAPLTDLVGRESAIIELVESMGRTRLLTLTGTGGVGKTRLAIRLAHQLSAGFPEGVAFVDLAPLEDPALLADTVRTAVGIPPDESRNDPLDFLAKTISDHSLLIVLDNCEHITRDCAALVQTLLHRSAKLKILATSREVLGVKGEAVWRVPSLETPKTTSRRVFSLSEIGNVKEFQRYPAIHLFSERARSAEAGFELTDRNVVSVAKICSLLDGIPLAIELAAAWVKVIPVEKIAQRLSDRFQIMLGRTRTHDGAAMRRHETLRASIDWSFDLLTEGERDLLQSLSVFVGGWTLDAAEAVCSSHSIPVWEVLELLTGLVEKSLVVYLQQEDRYRMLETIRQYMAQKQKTEKWSAVARQHLDYFLDFAETAEPELTGPRIADWLDRIEADHDNFRAALSWSRNALGDSDSGLRLAGALYRFWERRGFLAEGREQLALALAAGPQEPSLHRAKALNIGAILAYRQADYLAALALHQEALSIRRCLRDRAGEASSLSNLGVLALEQGNLDLAKSYYQESLSISREIGHRWGAALCLHHLGTVALHAGDYVDARRTFEESLAISRELGDISLVAHLLGKLGVTAHHQRDFTKAASLLEERLAIVRDVGDRLTIADGLCLLAVTMLALGEYEKARSMQNESLQINRELGNRTGIADCLGELAILEVEAPRGPGSNSRAARLFGAADALREAIGTPIAPNLRDDHLRQVGRVRDALEATAFDQAWTEGRTMSVEQAVQYALE